MLAVAVTAAHRLMGTTANLSESPCILVNARRLKNKLNRLTGWLDG